MRLAAAALSLLLVACAPIPRPVSDPLVFAQQTPQTDHLVIGIPGALSPVRVMQPLQNHAGAGRSVAFYRLPGFDNRPADEFVNLSFAAQRIAAAVRAGQYTRLDLVGHSTGAVIALEAAKEVRRTSPHVEVRVVGVSTALPAPQPLLAGARGIAGTVAAAARARSLSPRTVWLEYYRTLAYGPNASTDPRVAKAADALVAANDSRISLPEDGLARRHTRALRRWTNPAPDALGGVEVVFYHGAVDPVFPPRAVKRFAATLPRAELRLIDGHGHLLTLTYPDIWATILDQLGP